MSSSLWSSLLLLLVLRVLAVALALALALGLALVAVVVVGVVPVRDHHRFAPCGPKSQCRRASVLLPAEASAASGTLESLGLGRLQAPALRDSWPTVSSDGMTECRERFEEKGSWFAWLVTITWFSDVFDRVCLRKCFRPYAEVHFLLHAWMISRTCFVGLEM